MTLIANWSRLVSKSSVNEQSFVIEQKFRKWTRNSDLTNEKKSSVLNLLTELLKSERR